MPLWICDIITIFYDRSMIFICTKMTKRQDGKINNGRTGIYDLICEICRMRSLQIDRLTDLQIDKLTDF
jgi:hypothetical protein